MPRKRYKNEIIETEIYVILSSDSNEFYVGKTKNPNHYQAYKDHIRLKNSQTKSLFSRSINNGSLPKMYLLELINATKNESYAHCVVWTKYFLERGYSPVASQTTVEYANDLNDENKSLYHQIKDILIDEIICEDNLLVSNYELRQQKKKKNQIALCVTEEEYDFIQKQADYEGLTLSKFCKEMVIKGKIIRLDLSEYLREIRDVKKVMYEIQLAILQNGKYYPADLENLQKLVNRIDEGQKKTVKALTKQVKDATKHRKIKSKTEQK